MRQQRRPARAAQAVIALGLGLGLLLAACDRGADSGATANPNAPGSPGTGNPTVTATPQQPDARAGGSTGPVGAVPAPDAAGADMLRGTVPRSVASSEYPPRAPASAPRATAPESAASLPGATQGSTNRRNSY